MYMIFQHKGKKDIILLDNKYNVFESNPMKINIGQILCCRNPDRFFYCKTRISPNDRFYRYEIKPLSDILPAEKYSDSVMVKKIKILKLL